MDSYQMEYKCPSCGEKHYMTAWSAVNVGTHPELKEKVLDTSLFEFQCPHCGYTSGILYDCLYHDPERKIMIVLTGQETENAFENHGDISQSRYRLRTVHLPNELVEKILIFESGLDDRAVEIMKLSVKISLMTDHEDLDVRNLYFSVNDSGYGFVVETDEGFVGEVPADESVYREIERNMLKKMNIMQAEQTLINEDWAVNFIKTTERMN